MYLHVLYGRSCLNSEFFHHPLTLISALLLAGALPAAALFRAGRLHHHGSRAHRQMYADRAQENKQCFTDRNGRELMRTAQREFKFALLCPPYPVGTGCADASADMNEILPLLIQ